MFSVDSHGCSGRWHVGNRNYATLAEAVAAAREVKADGYGARVRLGEVVLVNAPWQEEIIEPAELVACQGGDYSEVFAPGSRALMGKG